MAGGQKTLEIGGVSIQPGETRTVEIPVARLPTQTLLHLSVIALHGRRPGPRMWVSAAVHGDEINGIEIIRRIRERIDPSTLSGTLLAVPIVNIFGFLNQSRYLPDRRDLNRSFPGSPRGSLAARLANLFLGQVVQGCTHGIDLHTAATGRDNMPQIRANLDDPQTRRAAFAFGAPVVMDARTRDGSLRAAAAQLGIPVLLYEGGEPNRFNETVIATGVRGILRVMSELGMIRGGRRARKGHQVESRSSHWIRARRSGLFHLEIELGARVAAKQRIGKITDGLGDLLMTVHASSPGIVIGATVNPLVNRGDALVHVAVVEENSNS